MTDPVLPAMQQPPDRPDGFPLWAVVVLVVAATAGGVWWITRGDSTSAPRPVATRAPCQPATGTPGPTQGQGESRTKDWTITVTSAAAEPSVGARGGGTYRAAPGEMFVVVAVTFRNRHPGSESGASTTLARLECADGTILSPVGFDDGRGFCRVCALDFGTRQRFVRWTLIYRMDQTFLSQPFRFRYGSAPPIDLSLSA